MAEDLRQALLQFAEAPGKYAIRLRQPALLFARLTDVLQLAAQRQAPADADTARSVDAARFFVRTALLHPEADAHAVLGVEEGAPAALVKERYRLLMRLLHPDFASAQSAWPADAAARVNRAYDYVSAGGAAPKPLPVATSPAPADRAARPAPQRPKASAAVAWNVPKSRLKHAFVLLGFIGGALMLVVLSIDRQAPVHLVQKPPVPKLPEFERDPAPEPPPRSSISATLSEMLADVSSSSSLLMSTHLGTNPAPRPVAQAPVPQAQVVVAARAPARPAPRTEPVPQDDPAPEVAAASGSIATRADTPADLAPPAVAAPPADPSRSVAARTEPAPATAPPAPMAPPTPRAGLTLAEAQPLLVALLQQMESGRGDRMLSLLEPEARMRPAAQAFSRTYDGVVDGARVRLAQVQFRAEPADGKLLVQGQMRVVFTDSPSAATRKFVLQAEFVNRNGTVVLTGLSGGPVN